ncbi:DUF4214 domain-containing protein [Azospirillum formosense]|uniref:DUF4214 domain-containing protein n=1 Tax=Azospirillum formosense TaxID=861533 RepID=A0ABX2KSB9_9PROT|nr:phycobilisome rod-core linker polypeptide [Azospirillum formosense]MBY3757674.1 DUF4214 domain-containing protein [Azospirillum formosense]NUB19541.1 DUF4214 domain-containing protein [Azospirillum formosense]
MAKKKWSFALASKISGQLYGNILLRNSDREGYEWCIEQLTTGSLTVRELVKKFCTSEEFREINLMNQTPNEFARIICKRFLGKQEEDQKEIKRLAVMILESDWRTVIHHVIDSDQYKSIYGDDKVPS